MSKEDIIPIYMVGINGDYPEYSNDKGVYSITHDLPEALELLSHIAKRRSVDESKDDRFVDPWITGEQLFVEKYEDIEVGKYLIANCENVSREQAEKLAKEHGFTLEEINWDHWR